MSNQNYQHTLVGAMGDPISENPSGLMMEAAFKALELSWRYQLLSVDAANLKNAMLGMRGMNFVGMNFTIPHKVAVLEHLDEIAEDAAIIGAVNTVHRKGDKLIGENTDGKGFLRALEDAKVAPNVNHVVILGAGGAARAMGVELALAGAKTITIINRSQERGETLAKLLNEKTPCTAMFSLWQSKHEIPSTANLVINATSIGLYPNINDLADINYDSLNSDMLVCDVIPNPPHTRFLQEAQKRGAKTLDGLAMLVYQGAIAFKLWTGQDAPTDVMHKALQDAFS